MLRRPRRNCFGVLLQLISRLLRAFFVSHVKTANYGRNVRVINKAAYLAFVPCETDRTDAAESVHLIHAFSTVFAGIRCAVVDVGVTVAT